ncbi:hypothetical protein [Methanolobus halotolerans]|uniref:Uncharacterized protein n=1 Tax=Methanolobus halotolerans TaxID=2052935 RepID=A0A4E0R1S2_9EURY|nr:hypothetical protein [Methanolobus halotolerans]TGC11139.1 hypothetical protein CUN85_03085 [Methanolobus halotolerans]
MAKLEKYVRAGYSLAIVLILAGMSLVIIAEEYMKGAITLINMGSVLLFVTFLRARRHRKGLVKGERTVRIVHMDYHIPVLSVLLYLTCCSG